LYFEQMTKQKYHYRKKCGGRGTLSGQQLLDQPTPLSSGEGRPFLHRRTDARSPALTASPTRAAERARGLPPGPPSERSPSVMRATSAFAYDSPVCGFLTASKRCSTRPARLRAPRRQRRRSPRRGSRRTRPLAGSPSPWRWPASSRSRGSLCGSCEGS
jgi:hypothetical protein